MKWRWLIPLAVVIFLCTLILRAPAAYVASWVMPANNTVKLYGIQGTLSQGQVAAVRYDKRPVLNHLHWTLQPWKLLLGRIALDLNGGTGDPRIHGTLQLSPSTLRASDLMIEAQLKTLLTIAGYSFLPFDGLLHLNIADLTASQTRVDALEATGTVRGLRWKLGTTPAKLGNFKIHAYHTDDGSIKATLASTSGPLQLSGQATLDATGHYALDLALKPRPDAPKNVVDLLRPLGRPDTTGTYHIHLHGQAPWPATAKPSS